MDVEKSAVRSLLVAARGLIERPGRWIQGAFACTHGGFGCRPEDLRATGWCAIGALYAVSDDTWKTGEATQVLESTIPEDELDSEDSSMKKSLAEFNDTEGRTHDEILALFERAIEKMTVQTEGADETS